MICGETIDLNQTTPTATVKITNVTTSYCLLSFQSPSNTQIIIDLRVLRLASSGDLLIYDSKGELVLSMYVYDGDGAPLNQVISDSYARLEFYTYYPSPSTLLSLNVHFTGNFE